MGVVGGKTEGMVLLKVLVGPDTESKTKQQDDREDDQIKLTFGHINNQNTNTLEETVNGAAKLF